MGAKWAQGHWMWLVSICELAESGPIFLNRTKENTEHMHVFSSIFSTLIIFVAVDDSWRSKARLSLNAYLLLVPAPDQSRIWHKKQSTTKFRVRLDEVNVDTVLLALYAIMHEHPSLSCPVPSWGKKSALETLASGVDVDRHCPRPPFCCTRATLQLMPTAPHDASFLPGGEHGRPGQQ
jgi:hypothetical protein